MALKDNEEVDSLRAELRDCQIGIEQRNDELKRMETELDRMRKALEDAPHDSNCCIRSWAETCTCWKSRSLNPQPEEDIPDYEAAFDELCGSIPGVAGEEAEIAQPEKIDCPSARLMLLCFFGACIFGPLGYFATGPIPASPLDAYRYTMAWSPFCVCISILLLWAINPLRNRMRDHKKHPGYPK